MAVSQPKLVNPRCITACATRLPHVPYHHPYHCQLYLGCFMGASAVPELHLDCCTVGKLGCF